MSKQSPAGDLQTSKKIYALQRFVPMDLKGAFVARVANFAVCSAAFVIVVLLMMEPATKIWKKIGSKRTDSPCSVPVGMKNVKKFK